MKSFTAVFPLLALLTLAAPTSAQIDSDPGSAVRTREDLVRLLRQYEELLQSPAYSEAAKDQARAQAQRVRERLEEGDFRLGDRVVLSVQGEPNLPDTIPVEAGPIITLPLFGEISLRGVLRSELDDRITEALSTFIREPVVNAEGLMRVSVQGAVAQPGYYVVPADMLLSETLMLAGGPAADADPGGLRIERGSEVVLQGEELQEHLRQGLTLDQLNLQAGDQLTLPRRGSGFFSNFGVVLGILTSVTLVIVQISR